VDASGQDLRAVTAVDPNRPVDDFDPAYSPDGTQIAYAETSQPRGAAVAGSVIMVATADGSGAHAVTAFAPGDHQYGPTWSPDGSMIAFGRQGDGSDLYVVRLSDGQEFGPLRAAPQPDWFNFADPAWSPVDRNTIAITAQSRDGPMVVKLTVAVTATAVTITSLVPLDTVDGAACPLVSRTSILVPPRSAVADAQPAWSPDGGRIAFAGYQHRALCLVNADGSGGHLVNLGSVPIAVPSGEVVTVANPAFAPDGTVLAAELAAFNGDISGAPSIVAVTPAGSPPAAGAVISATSQLWVDNAAAPAFDPIAGPVGLDVTATPTPGYRGGDPIAVTYTLRNRTNQRLARASLVAVLPAPLPLAAVSRPGCTPAACPLGTVPPGGTAAVTFTLTPAVAVNAIATGTASYVDASGGPRQVTGQAPVVVAQPTIVFNPVLGPPGIVTVITGASFPPKARVTFTWSPGISAPVKVTVRPDGTFQAQMLVLEYDVLGPRTLTAHHAGGRNFGDVMPTDPFLVVPGAPQPPKFFGRG
jgi:hypothetical protein